MRHFHEKLRRENDIKLSYTSVQKALQGAGLVAAKTRRTNHRRRRERRPLEA
jgi:transposase